MEKDRKQTFLAENSSNYFPLECLFLRIFSKIFTLEWVKRISDGFSVDNMRLVKDVMSDVADTP